MQTVPSQLKHVPPGYHSVTPYLNVEGATKLIDFLKHTFNAEETFRVNGPDGGVAHAEVKIGDSNIMISDADAMYKANTSSLYLYVENVDLVYKRGIEAGATSVSEPKDQSYGDRSASLKDPAGNTWAIATHMTKSSP